MKHLMMEIVVLVSDVWEGSIIDGSRGPTFPSRGCLEENMLVACLQVEGKVAVIGEPRRNLQKRGLRVWEE